MNEKKLVFELECIAGELELQAYESGDFGTEEMYMNKAAIIREAVRRLSAYAKRES